MLAIADAEGIGLPDVMARYEEENTGSPPEETMKGMASLWAVMEKSVRAAFENPEAIELQITENDSLKMSSAFGRRGSLLGGAYYSAMMYALSVSALNASMGRVAACPTGGSCGVVPGCLAAAKETGGFSDAEIARALLAASAVGLAIQENATLAGAIGGCQAEIGSAAAMAAAAVCELFGAGARAAFEAAAIALKSLMGLVCDPVASLVESPCSKRNATAACLAFGAAEMAMAGVQSAVPFDEVVGAMDSVAKKMPAEHRETSRGGIAISPTGLALAEKVFGRQWRQP
jgi:L-serine dehydratase